MCVGYLLISALSVRFTRVHTKRTWIPERFELSVWCRGVGRVERAVIFFAVVERTAHSRCIRLYHFHVEVDAEHFWHQFFKIFAEFLKKNKSFETKGNVFQIEKSFLCFKLETLLDSCWVEWFFLFIENLVLVTFLEFFFLQLSQWV